MRRNVKLPKGVNAFVDRHGRPRYYLRRPGSKAIALPGLPWSPPFMAAYHGALAGQPEPIGASRTAPGSFRALVVSHYGSIAFGELRASTAKRARYVLEKFCREHGHRLFADLRREHVVRLLSARADQPGGANGLRKALRSIMRHALEMGWIATDPTAGVRPLKSRKPDGHHSWSEAEISAFEARWPIGSRERLALALLLHTGQRRGDVIRMGRQHVGEGVINVRQEKTGAVLAIPLDPELAEAIEATPRGHLTFLTTKHGGPFTPSPFSDWFTAAAKAAGLVDCTAHGLRKAAARRLAEAGCTPHEIAAITGHASLAEVTRYTRAVDQRRLAASAKGKVRK